MGRVLPRQVWGLIKGVLVNQDRFIIGEVQGSFGPSVFTSEKFNPSSRPVDCLELWADIEALPIPFFNEFEAVDPEAEKRVLSAFRN